MMRAIVVALASAGIAASAPTTAWAPAGAVTESGQGTLVGQGIAVSPDGTGVLAWQAQPDRETDHLATFSAGAPPHPLRLARPLVGATQLAALSGGVALGGVNPVTRWFELRFGAAGAPMTPGESQNLQLDAAVIAADADADAVAVLGTSGAAPVLTICRPAGCGRSRRLAASTGPAPSTLAVAISPRGAILAAWIRNGRVEARVLDPSGRLGALHELARVHTYAWLAAAMSAGGRAALIWESQDDRHPARPGPATSATVAQDALATGGTFGSPHTLASFPPGAGTALSEPPVVAVAFDSERPVGAWTSRDRAGFAVQSADLDDVPATLQTLSTGSAVLGALAGAAGRGLLASWLECTPGVVCFPWRLEAAEAPPGGAFASAAVLSPGPFDPTEFSVGAAAAIDPRSGTAFVAAAQANTLSLYSSSP